MKILFDQNTPRGIARHLMGHEVSRALELGWSELKNGVLLKAAEDAGFDLLVTCDRNIAYQQSPAGRKLAVLELSTNNWELNDATGNVSPNRVWQIHAAPVPRAVRPCVGSMRWPNVRTVVVLPGLPIIHL